jgi:hypothetical protein
MKIDALVGLEEGEHGDPENRLDSRRPKKHGVRDLLASRFEQTVIVQLGTTRAR